MSNDKVPTSKIARASKFLKTGARVGRNYAKHYSKKAVGKKVTRDDLEKDNARDIFEGFTELRGTALKVAQMLSMDNINFSANFTNVMQKAQYSVPPMSAPMAIQAFKKSIGKNPSEVFDEFDPNARRAASMGQVHTAMKDGKKMAVKIQYPGVADSIKSDMKMVKGAASRVMKLPASELTPYFEEIEERLIEEADYELEIQNSMQFAEDCKHIEGLVFPTYYPELSSSRVITMEWIDGVHLREFMANDPPYELREQLAYKIWEFYEYQMHKLRRINADPHPGNFLFREDGTLGVLDFGCTKRLTDDIHADYFRLADPFLFEDRERAERLMEEIDLLRPEDEGKKRDKLYDVFSRMISMISLPYHQGYFDFTDETYYNKLTEIGQELADLHELRGSRHYIFLNKTYYGLYSLFNELGVKLHTICKYHRFVHPDKIAPEAQDKVSPEDIAINPNTETT